MRQSACLATVAAAMYVCAQVELILRLDGREWEKRRSRKIFVREEVFLGFAVDGYLAGTFGQTDPSDCCLAAADSEIYAVVVCHFRKALFKVKLLWVAALHADALRPRIP